MDWKELLAKMAARRNIEPPKDGDIKHRVCMATITGKAAQPDDADIAMRIEGYASTNDVDSYNEIVLPSAFAGTMASFMEFPVMLFGHHWSEKPIGKWLNYKIDDRGLWVEGVIYNTAEGKDVALLVDNGILKALSIGFSYVTLTFGEDKDPDIVEALNLWEVSVVNIPANRGALFEQAKQHGLELKSINQSPQNRAGGKHHRSNVMTPEELKALTDKLSATETQVETALSRVGDMENQTQKAAEMLRTLGEKVKAVEGGTASQSEVEEFKKAMADDFLAIKKQVEDGQKAVAMYNETRVSPGDLVSRAACFDRHTTDSGKALMAGKARMRELLITPVKEDGTREAETLKAFRNAADVLLIENAYRHGIRGNMYRGAKEECKAFAIYEKLLDAVDPQFKAMYSTGTDLGDEWVPEIMAQALFDEIKMEAVVEPTIPVYNMPSNPATYPVVTSLPTMYVAAEATTNNPSNMLASDIGTGKVTFTATKFNGLVRLSDEFEEDAIFDVASEVRSRIARCLAKGMDSVILNGDTTATHRDTDVGYTSISPESTAMGMRYTAIDRSAHTSEGGALEAASIRANREIMGSYGVNPREVKCVTSLGPYFDLLSLAQASQPGTYGANATWLTGEIFSFDGHDVLISDQLSQGQHTDGTVTNSGAKRCLIHYNTTAWRVGVRRGVTIEYARDPYTGQMGFIATMRKDFQTLCETTTVLPVGLLYNIT